ncbi:VOC family protein [Gordonia sp. CPCC 206044]|uniref:VOC family protein n=1 Tax=Gordonia sp. CPCC 206044 TaxID=3140793 RepID=UPI003AF3CE0D
MTLTSGSIRDPQPVSEPHVANVRWPTLDHLAVGVRSWRDAYPRFVSELGGRWAYGGSPGGYAPYQLAFGDGLRLEFISPGRPDGFLDRFLQRRGPSAHHLTFKVPDLDEAVRDLTRLGFGTFGDSRAREIWMDTFVHPRDSGIGTLVQVARADDEAMVADTDLTSSPAGFPSPGRQPLAPSVIGVTASDLVRAHDLLGRALLGDVIEDGDGWFFATWGTGRSMLVREPSAFPCGDRLWSGLDDPGVSFVVFADGDPTATTLAAEVGSLVGLPEHPATGVPVWLMG